MREFKVEVDALDRIGLECCLGRAVSVTTESGYTREGVVTCNTRMVVYNFHSDRFYNTISWYDFKAGDVVRLLGKAEF